MKRGIILYIVIIIVIIVGYFAFIHRTRIVPDSNISSQDNPIDSVVNVEQNQKSVDKVDIHIDTTDWQVYSDKQFSYRCPPGMLIYQKLNYGGQVTVHSCSINYDKAEDFSFDNGIDIGFSFVPQPLQDSQWGSEQDRFVNYLKEIKDEPQSQIYINNGFVGYSVMNSKNGSIFYVIARQQTVRGVFEVWASAVGNQKTPAEFKRIVDEIISTFVAHL